MIVCAVVIYCGIISIPEDKYFNDNAIKTDATIFYVGTNKINVRIEVDGIKYSKSFQTENEDYKVGQKINAYYLKDKPDDFVIRKTSFLAGYLAIFIGLIFEIAIILDFVKQFKKLSRS